jgi:hypothetical protein
MLAWLCCSCPFHLQEFREKHNVWQVNPNSKKKWNSWTINDLAEVN